jgi:hypothetical protein
MATQHGRHLVQTWVKVTDPRGRTRMEARWVLVDDTAHKHAAAAA